MSVTDAPVKPYRVLLDHSNTDEWLALRKTGVGASEAAAVLGQSGWGTAKSVWDQKLSDKIEDFTTDLMKFGHLAEDVIEKFMLAHPERYAALGEIVPAEGLLQSIEYPYLLGTLDRMIRTPLGFYVPLEMKSVNDFVVSEWKEGGEDEPTSAAGWFVPRIYQIQVQMQMAVIGAPFAYVAVWLGKARLEVIRVERDQDYIDEMLIGKVGDFWNYFVTPKVMPPLSLNDDLWKVYPGDDTLEPWVADEDLIDLIGLFRVNADDKRARDKEMKQIKFDIVDTIGDHTQVVNGDGDVIHTLKAQDTPRGTDFIILEAKYPKVYEEVIRPAGRTRVHRPTKVKVD